MPAICPQCDFPFPVAAPESEEFSTCPVCGAESLVRVFPALLAPAAAPTGETAGESEAVCFDHPRKRAAAACSQCGRFVCALCATEFRGECWCPQCLAAGVQKKRVTELENSRTLYDSIALGLATLPALLISPTLLTAPATLLVSLIYWKKPLGLVRRWRWRMVLALVLALAEIGFWVTIVVVAAIAARKAK
jgi:hypothetical protein